MQLFRDFAMLRARSCAGAQGRGPCAADCPAVNAQAQGRVAFDLLRISAMRSYRINLKTGPQTARRPADPHDAAVARIGPNAVIQTLRALRERESPEVARLVPVRAELPEAWPEGMIPEAWFVRLVEALRATLPAERAEAVLRQSGAYTADYVGRHRIPALFRALLRLLPARLGIPLLLTAFRRHAWTFAGSGRFQAEGAFPGTIVMQGCPTCRAEAAAPAAGHAGAYYEAAFEGLLRLAAAGVRVREVSCQGGHAALCRFEISLKDPALGEPPCASS